MLLPLKKLIERRVKKLKLDSQVNAARVCDVSEKIIKNFFNKKINFKNNSYFKDFSCGFKKGTLKIKKTSPLFLNELRLNEDTIKQEINRRLGGRMVKKIIF